MRDDGWELELLDAVRRSADSTSWLPAGVYFEEVGLRGVFPDTTLVVRLRTSDPSRTQEFSFPLWDDLGQPEYRDLEGDREDVTSAATLVLTNVMEGAGRRYQQPKT
jgi:hypothetical protein